MLQAPEGVAGQEAGLLQASNGRDEGTGARRNHDVASAQGLLRSIRQAHGHRPGRSDAGVALQHLHAQRGVALDAVVRRDGLNHRLHAMHHRREIHLALRIGNAQLPSLPHLRHGLGRANQGFAGHAAIVEAIPAHFVSLDQGDLGLDRCGQVGRHQSPRTSTNDHQVAVKALGARPAGVDLARLQGSDHELGHQRKQTQQHQTAQQRRGQHVTGRFDRGQLRAGIDIHRSAGEHADLADDIELAGAQGGQAHQQVDQPKRKHRHQTQGEQVKSAVLGQTFVDGLKPLPQSLFDDIAQQIARNPKGQQCPQAGGEGHQQQAQGPAKHGPSGQGQDNSAGHRQGSGQHVHREEDQRRLRGVGGVKARQRVAAGLEPLQREPLAQVPLLVGGPQAHQGQQQQDPAPPGCSGTHRARLPGPSAWARYARSAAILGRTNTGRGSRMALSQSVCGIFNRYPAVEAAREVEKRICNTPFQAETSTQLPDRGVWTAEGAAPTR